MSGAVYFILTVLYILDSHFEFSYSFVAPYLAWTSEDWYKGMAIFMAGVAVLVEKYDFIKVPRGVVTRDGIMLVKKNTVIPFQSVEKINTDQKGIAVMKTSEGEIEVRMDEWDIVKLPRAGFMHWSIDKNTAVISRGPAGAGLSAAYPPTGKYANRGFAVIVAVAAFLGVIFLICANLVGLEFFVCLPLLFLFPVIFNDYKEVAVTIEDNGIKLKDENLAEHFIAFADIGTVEKGWVRTKLTAKDRRVLYLPQALYLLPEFIEEYAKPGKA